MTNSLLSLHFEPALEELGDSYWDLVSAARFPLVKLRFRNDPLFQELGINPELVDNQHIEDAYGHFEGRTPFLALRYHGYQFGSYNPFLGDGRGFLYGQLRDIKGNLRDLGTKGSGVTPWSRSGDGRLTLKGGLREVIASEALHRLGVTTSRTLSLIETGEDLWRSDEPSPARSSVMVRVARTHLRFGTCERLLYLRDPSKLQKLLRHVIAIYYPHIAELTSLNSSNFCSFGDRTLLLFYEELVERVARLSAEWMAAGFVHGVLNTDNMSLIGESFDYGPYAFLDRWDPGFTAAYFDQAGLYCYGSQPKICQENLRLLQDPLAMLLSRDEMEDKLLNFSDIYAIHYRQCMERRLGFSFEGQKLQGKYHITDAYPDLVQLTLNLLGSYSIGYGDFFTALTEQILQNGLPKEPEDIRPTSYVSCDPPREQWLAWRDLWWFTQQECLKLDHDETTNIPFRLKRWNLLRTPTREVIENLWESIDLRDDWSLFYKWLEGVVFD